MLPKAVLFDVDGTLVDSNEAHARAWSDALREFGHDVPPEAVRPQIGKGGDQLMPAFLSADRIEEVGEALSHLRGEILKARYLLGRPAFPGALELLRRANAAGLRVALASSAKGDELAALKRIIGLEEGDLDAETSADDVERSKPEPDIFEAALARFPGVSPDEVLVVGDTLYNAEAAAKAGIRTIGMLCGGFPEDALRGAGCIAIYRDPAHLLAEFDASPLGAGAMPD